jgi:adenosylcobyric acid synthase
MKLHGHLMVQGCTSDAGKSIMVAAIGRILARHKVSVAPFKPQNMALNSAVTKEGGEIGRAQAVQAEACYLEASVEMNPVLLKPNSDTGSQVIVNGHAIGNMDARTYHQYKPELLGRVVDCYKSLGSKYDVVIIEGAGSPAEINLREHDIANMGFAEAVDCPVIIIADIDRGGVFAHLYGTYELLSASEQQRVKGFVINRFRGDVSLLTPGLDWLEEKTGIPVLGVIPYLMDLHIEAEDALNTSQINGQKNEQNSLVNEGKAIREKLKVVVPIYPRASNHTDFDVLRLHPHIDCQFMRDARDFQGADLIVLPGSKSVRSDLQSLKDAGWESVIKRHLRYGGKLIGICGGFQMLGKHIHDPEGIESSMGTSKGLGFINMETTLTPNKILKLVAGQLVHASTDNKTPSEAIKVSGYEIHAGISQGEGLASPLLSLSDEQGANATDEGARNVDDSVWGSYLHGLFDESDFLTHILQWAGSSLDHPSNTDHGLSEGKLSNYNYAEFRDQQFNRLADAVETVISFETLSKIILDERISE